MKGKQIRRWWDEDTEEDKALLNIVWIAEGLGRLPTKDEVPNIPRTPFLGRTVTYFGSFEKALREVAELLYGDKTLKSPKELTLREQKLSPEEQRMILENRWRMYRAMLDELRIPGALVRRRRKRDAWMQRVRYERGPRKRVFYGLPVRSPDESKKETRRPAERVALKTISEVVAEPTMKPKEDIKLATETAKPVKPRVKVTKPVIRRQASGSGRRTKNGVEMRRMQAIETLWETHRKYGGIPTMAQVDAYARGYVTSAVLSAAEVCQVLGGPNTWEEHLKNYAGARGLQI